MRQSVVVTLAVGGLWLGIPAGEGLGQPLVPAGANFEIDFETRQDPVKGRPAIAADGSNFFVVWQESGWLNGIWGASASELYIVGDYRTILHYDGASWTPQDSGTSAHLYGVWGLGPSEVWTVGLHGTILALDECGWVPETSGTTQDLMAVVGDGGMIWAVGDGGVILRRNLEATIFSDGFESGDTSAWSGSVP